MSNDVDAQTIAGHWVHAHEEDANDEQVFRPADRPMPPSRGRTTLELNANGTLGRIGPGADDRTVRASGRWRVDGRRLSLARDGGGEASYDVVSVAPDRLVLKPDR